MSVKKLIIDIRGNEIELSLEEAKALYASLDSIFGAKHSWYSWYPYQQPVTIPSTYFPTSNPPIIASSNLNSSMEDGTSVQVYNQES